MSKTLTREQRAAIFAGEAPRIAGEGECPWEPGDVYKVSSCITLTVEKIRPVKERWRDGKRIPAGWALGYHIWDRRDTLRYMRPNPHPVDYTVLRDELDAHGGYPAPNEDADEFREEGEQSAYTWNRARAVRGEDYAVGEEWLARFADEAGDRKARERRARRQQERALPLERRIVTYQAEAACRRIDIRNELRLIERLKRQGKGLDNPVEGIRRKLDSDLGRAA